MDTNRPEPAGLSRMPALVRSRLQVELEREGVVAYGVLACPPVTASVLTVVRQVEPLSVVYEGGTPVWSGSPVAIERPWLVTEVHAHGIVEMRHVGVVQVNRLLDRIRQAGGVVVEVPPAVPAGWLGHL